MAEAIPQAELVVMPDTGHSVPRDAPKALLQTIFRFLPESAA
jgi:pimeloyl-ACP methyl ester carboxylesterase